MPRPGRYLKMPLMVQYKRGLEVPKAPPFSCKTQLNESEGEKKSLYSRDDQVFQLLQNGKTVACISQ